MSSSRVSTEFVCVSVCVASGNQHPLAPQPTTCPHHASPLSLCVFLCALLQEISTCWPDSRAALERLQGELELSLDKLVTREKFLNDQFDTLMSQYRAARGQMQGVQVGESVCVCVCGGVCVREREREHERKRKRV